MSEHRVFALEGIDGSGKTIVGQLVAEKTGGRYFYNMDNHPLKRVRPIFDTASTEVRFLYYLAIPLVNYVRVEKMRKNSDVFFDRTIASTVAYHKAYGLSDRWFSLIPSFLYDQIDTMLYFSVREEERIRRMNSRKVTKDTMTASDQKSFEYSKLIDSAYRAFLPEKTLIIETDNKTPEEVALDVINKINA